MSRVYNSWVDKQTLRTVGTVIIWILAIALGGFFVLSGGLKLYSPLQESIQMMAARVPPMFALPFTVLLASVEVFAGILLLIPGWRRAGAVLSGAMLVAFMGYMGLQYSELKGSNCGCLPGLNEALGPWFFVRDGAMLAAAIVVFPFSRAAAGRSRSLLRPLIVLLVILGVGGASATLERSLRTADTLTLHVQGQNGGVTDWIISPRTTTLLYFYEPT